MSSIAINSSTGRTVLTTLSYICGPLVEDWVNTQDLALKKCVNSSILGFVTKTDEVLWIEFKAQFKSAWQDTAKTQSAYEKLIKLMMQGYDVDTYNAMFTCLASATEWEPNAKGTVDWYRQCHGSAGTPLRTHANGEDSGLEESRAAIRT
jgi:hypothetical protein